MIQPTISRRIEALDVMRGFAILGILLANIHAFSSLHMGQMSGEYLAVSSKGDEWLNATVLGFVVGKMRSLLAILFGIGLYLQYKKRVDVAGAWPRGYLKRTLILALIGLIHGLLIWFGDILFMYALVAFIACWFVMVRSRWLAVISGCIMGLAALVGLIVFIAGFIDLGPEATAAMAKEAAEFAAGSPAYSSGTYLDQVAHRWDYFASSAGMTLIFVFMALPLFLTGIMIARTGVIERPSKHPAIRNWILAVGLGAGLPMNLLAFILPVVSNNGLSALAWEILFGPTLALGYLMLLAMWVEAGGPSRLRAALENVGRTALTCYLLQSLICTFIFYSWGLGWFDRVGAPAQLAIVGGVWIVVATFAHYWLQEFTMGPVEWMWRSATEGRVLPIQRSARPAT